MVQPEDRLHESVRQVIRMRLGVARRRAVQRGANLSGIVGDLVLESVHTRITAHTNTAE